MEIFLAILLAWAQEKPPPTVLRGGQLVTLGSRPVETGSVLVDGGKIRELGPDLQVPAGATVLELPKGSWVLPGFIDLHSHLGSAFEVEESTEAFTPQVKAVEAFTSRHPEVLLALGSGVTAVALSPGNGNVVGGRIGVVRLSGGRYDRALYRDCVALKASLGPQALRHDREPTSEAGAVRMLREFLKAPPPGVRDLPVFVHVETTGEIESALELLAGGPRPAVLLHAREATRLGTGRLAGVTVALGPLSPADPREVLQAPSALVRAGAKIAFVSDAPASSEEHLRVTASFAVKYGLDREEALRALTVHPAEALGLSKDLGTLEAGKEADLVVWSGDPLTLSSSVELVMVGGAVVFRKEGKP